MIAWLEAAGPRPRRDHVPAARLAVQPAALLGRAVPDRLRRDRPAGRAARVDAAGRAARDRRLLAAHVRPGRRRHRAGDAAVAGQGLGRGRAGPGRRPEALHPRDQHDAAVGRLVLVRAALPGPDQRQGAGRPGERARTGWARGRPADCGGVDLYVGGVEHAVLHLLYARFWHKVLFDLGHVSSFEPFRRCSTRATSRPTPTRDARGSTCRPRRSSSATAAYFYGDQQVNREYGKMGKSLKNVVTPDEMCEQYGADTFRVYEMSMGPLDVSRPWETRAVVGSHRFLQRVWRLVVDEETGAVAGRRRAAGPTRDRDGCCTGPSTASAPTWTRCGSTPRSPS